MKYDAIAEYDKLNKLDWAIAIVGGVFVAIGMFYFLAPIIFMWFINMIAN